MYIQERFKKTSERTKHKKENLEERERKMFRMTSKHERFLWIIIVGVLLFYLGSVIFQKCNMGVPINAISVSNRNVSKTGAAEKKVLPSDSTPKYSEAKVFRWNDGKWKRVSGFCSKADKFMSTPLRTPFGVVKMYIHDIRNDVHVSGSIKRSGMWDSSGVSTMVSFLRTDPNMGFLDLGSQLGTFSLVAAKMGRRVVAVDPLVENVLRLCRTVQEGNMTDRLTILFTALSDSYRTVTFKRYTGNIGGTHIETVKNAKLDVNDNYNANLINTVHLDDILPFVDFAKAFIKIDVENHEYEALKEGKKLFTSKDIRGILMEWFQIKLSPNGEKILKFLTNQTFHALDPVRRNLLSSNYKKWPNDILWVKK